MFFPIVFSPLIIFPSAGFISWPKDSYERGREKEKEGKGKRRGKEEGRVSYGPFLIPKVIVFVIVLLSFVNPVYVFWKWLQSSKKECSDHLPGTFLVQNLTRIRWCAIMTTNNEMKKPKTLNSCRTTDKQKTLDFKSLDRTLSFFFPLVVFRMKAKHGSWGIMED